VATLGNCYPVVLALCGIAFYGEFRGTSRRAWASLLASLSCYVGAVALIVASAPDLP
jgi:hypothetical protein